MSFHIITDTCTDFPLSFASTQKDLTILPLTYETDGVTYTPDGTDAFTLAFYEQMRSGKVSRTSQVNSETWKEAFENVLAQGQDVLCIAFSSGLSGTYQAAVLAQSELAPKYPDRKLVVIDSLSASLGQGMLVYYALKMRDEGASFEEIAQWVRDHISKAVIWFTVDDLQYLRRGGRVSAVSAYIGGIVNIKPILFMDAAGKLIPREKVTGRKRSLRVLCDKICSLVENPEEQTLFITHGDCEQEAQWLAEQIRSKAPFKDVMIGLVGPVIGSHSGPGTMAVFCLGNGR